MSNFAYHITYICIRMKFAIIAAGEGSRLSREGIHEPKPLVRVCGEALIDRLLRVFADCGAEEICVVCNGLTPYVEQHLRQIADEGLDGRAFPLRFVVRNTPSSMHSFHELSPLLAGSPFVLTTVDTIFREEEFRAYVAAFEEYIAHGGDGMMGLTDYIDDEKPLYVATDADMMVTGFYDQNTVGCTYISGGIYGLTPSALDTLQGCMDRGESRMRNFQRALVSDGRKLKGYAFSKVLDIDHASDVSKAEVFLSSKIHCKQASL